MSLFSFSFKTSNVNYFLRSHFFSHRGIIYHPFLPQKVNPEDPYRELKCFLYGIANMGLNFAPHKKANKIHEKNKLHFMSYFDDRPVMPTDLKTNPFQKKK